MYIERGLVCVCVCVCVSVCVCVGVWVCGCGWVGEREQIKYKGQTRRGGRANHSLGFPFMDEVGLCFRNSVAFCKCLI